jgi:hypothetical protein
VIGLLVAWADNVGVSFGLTDASKLTPVRISLSAGFELKQGGRGIHLCG